MGAVYFDYQGKFPPNGYRYIVKVSKRDANGVDRSPIELRIVAWSILLNGLGVTPADVLIRLEIEKTRFDKMMKEQVFRGTDGAIYKVLQETTA
jgi:hypothetical protein